MEVAAHAEAREDESCAGTHAEEYGRSFERDPKFGEEEVDFRQRRRTSSQSPTELRSSSAVEEEIGPPYTISTSNDRALDGGAAGEGLGMEVDGGLAAGKRGARWPTR